MTVEPQIRLIASQENLDLAWLRLRTSTERTYREYFRTLYRAYGIAADAHLKVLGDALLGGYYEPSAATKVFFPKQSGLQRVYTLLNVEDQIAYQAITNIIADRLYRRTKNLHLRNVFGHIYAGPGNAYFYRDWRRSYTSYAGAMRRAFKDGYHYAASFDLTACYDSIDHGVLKHFLDKLGISTEVSTLLCHMLHKWTDTSPLKPIHHGHGIPQGPSPSGLLAEVVLAHFDVTARKHRLRYFRYVDDIRVFAREELTIRRELIALDIKSKEVGLFPQSSKVSIHRVTNIEDEIKGISQPSLPFGQRVVVDQEKLKKALTALSPRFRIKNATKFKYDLGSADPDSKLVLRLLAIIDRDPSFYEPACRYIARCPRLSRKASQKLLDVLRAHDLYPGFAAGLLRAARENTHKEMQAKLYSYCRSRLSGRRASRSHELRAAAAANLLWNQQLSWQESKRELAWKGSAWVRAWTLAFLRPEHLGTPSFEAIVHQSIHDTADDPALVATELLITHRLTVPQPVRNVNAAAQRTLQAVGKIGRVQRTVCPIRDRMVHTLGPETRPIVWTKVFDPRTYKAMTTRVALWSSYAKTDSTAWVVLTDTINDILLSALFKHDGTIGGYTLGSIGSALQPASRFAAKYPQLFRISDRIHALRLAADLVHPITRRTNAPTGRIAFREVRKLKRPLAKGYIELWQKW